MEEKKGINWGLIIGGLALIATGIWIFTAYQSGTLGRLRLPSFIWLIYKVLGVEAGAVIQSILGAVMIFFGIKSGK